MQDLLIADSGDGTVFVGSWDTNLYALDGDVSGSSEDSRVNLGTLGHHNGWTGTHKDRHDTDTTPDNDTQIGSDNDNQSSSSDRSPGLGISTTITGVAGAGYVLKREIGKTD